MTYIHPGDKAIKAFVKAHIHDLCDVRAVCDDLFRWFDENVKYSRLNAPFFPLQRSDLDVLSMRSGTCGDYSNLIVSVLLSLGYDAQYAYVHRDCYGDEQDHICAAVREGQAWILIDATQPYRIWYGHNCPHQAYELLTPEAFEARMKKEEAYWTDKAKQYGDERCAGLLYAPWLHEEVLRQSGTVWECVFFLLSIDGQKSNTLYAYDLKYTKAHGSIPMMGIVSDESTQYCFSCKEPQSIWDNDQWGQPYAEDAIPRELKTEAFSEFKKCIESTAIHIRSMLRELNASNA